MDDIEIVDENTLRPYVSDIDIEVHKVYSSYEKGLSIDDIISGYRNMHNVLSEIDDDSMNTDVNLDKKSNVTNITERHIKKAIEYAKSNEDLIADIQEEQDKLTRLMLDNKDGDIVWDDFAYFEKVS